MRVYYAGPRNHADHSALVCPAADPRGIAMGVASEWLDENGEPKGIMVTFKAGVAEVPDSVGRYLVAVKMAKRTRLILPRAAA